MRGDVALAIVLVGAWRRGVIARQQRVARRDSGVVFGAAPVAISAGGSVAVLVPDASAMARDVVDPRGGSSSASRSSRNRDGAIVAAILGSPVGRWAHMADHALTAMSAASPMSQAGRGRAVIEGTGATAYLGPGRGSHWRRVPAHRRRYTRGSARSLPPCDPGAVHGPLRSKDGAVLVALAAGWRSCVVSTTWRDQVVGGSFPAGGLSRWPRLGAIRMCSLSVCGPAQRGRRNRPARRGPNPGLDRRLSTARSMPETRTLP